MRARVASRLAWSLWAVTIVITAAALVLLVMTRFTYPPEVFGFPGFAALVAIAYSTVGALVASRRPSNAIGWLFVTMGLLSAVQEATTAFSVLAFVQGTGNLPGAEYAAWVVDWIWIPLTGGLVVFTFALFPQGRLQPRTGTAVAILGGLGIALSVTAQAIRPGPLETFPTVDNPLAVTGSADVAAALFWGFQMSVVVGVLAIIGMTRRWRRASGLERAQYKWLIAAGMLLAIGFLVVVTIGAVDPRASDRVWLGLQLPLVLGFMAIPVAVGIAILRYRLYEIDRLISRTVAYALLVAVLGAVYVGSVLLLGRLLPTQSDVAVAASTLAVAALFNPLRRRLQLLVDRRFNRARYDLARIVEDFGTKLRDELDIDEVSGDLVAVVTTTVQADKVSVWLADSDA